MISPSEASWRGSQQVSSPVAVSVRETKCPGWDACRGSSAYGPGCGQPDGTTTEVGLHIDTDSGYHSPLLVASTLSSVQCSPKSIIENIKFFNDDRLGMSMHCHGKPVEKSYLAKQYPPRRPPVFNEPDFSLPLDVFIFGTPGRMKTHCQLIERNFYILAGNPQDSPPSPVIGVHADLTSDPRSYESVLRRNCSGPCRRERAG